MRWTLLFVSLLACGPVEEQSSELETLRGGRSRFWLADGEVVTGYLGAIYDHSRWIWGPSDETTYGVLVGDRFRFLSSYDVVDARGIGDWPRPEVLEFARSRGIAFDRSPIEGVSHVWTGNGELHDQESGYGDFAWDLRITDLNGRAFSGSGTKNSDFYVWSQPVYLPTSGVVVDLVRNVPDNPAGEIGPPSGNYLDVMLDGDFKLCLVHLKQNSIPAWIEPGMFLEAGTFVGRVGNSGYTRRPHLHLTIYQWDDETQRLWSVPSEFNDVFIARSLETSARFWIHAVPKVGSYVSRDPF